MCHTCGIMGRQVCVARVAGIVLRHIASCRVVLRCVVFAFALRCVSVVCRALRALQAGHGMRGVAFCLSKIGPLACYSPPWRKAPLMRDAHRAVAHQADRTNG